MTTQTTTTPGEQDTTDPAVRLEFDYFVIDTAQWIAARAGERSDRLTDSLHEHQGGRVFARDAFTDWLDAEGLAISDDYLSGSYNTANSENNLSEELKINLIHCQGTGLAYVVITPHLGSSTVYRNDAVHDDAAWLEWDAIGIVCPNDRAHAWEHRNGEIVDRGGSCRRVSDLWPDGLVTENDDEQPQACEQSQILCPHCAVPCAIYAD